MKKNKNFLFDLDGTLVDTGEGIIESVKYALNCEKIDNYADDLLMKFVGPPLKNSFISLLKVSEEEANKLVIIFREYYSDKGKYKCKLYEGIIKLLEVLKINNYRIFVATSKPTIFAVDILNKLNISKYFEEIVGSNIDNTRSKKVEIINYIVEKYKLDKEETVLIGDTVFDEDGAYFSKINFIGVNYGYGFNQNDSNCYSINELISICEK